jgi:hypothetical protein
LKATLQLLDRADVNAKTSIDVEVSAKPWEQVMEGMVDRIEITSGDHYLRSVGELPPAKTDDSRAATGYDDSSMFAGRETRHDDDGAGVRGTSAYQRRRSGTTARRECRSRAYQPTDPTAAALSLAG